MEARRSNSFPIMTEKCRVTVWEELRKAVSDTCIVVPETQRSGVVSSKHRSLSKAFASTLSGLPIKGTQATFRCCVCRENVSTENRSVLAECGRNRHAACRECLVTYMTICINENRVEHLRCPCHGTDGCRSTASTAELKKWLDADTHARYLRFKEMRADPTKRECPGCNALCTPISEDGKVVPEMTCHVCYTSFCYYHSNAHEPTAEACSQYERTVAKQERANAGILGAKLCPKCGAPTEKLSGCNHMVCHCTAEWCWICGKELDNAGWHYNPMNPNSCMQFQTSRDERDVAPYLMVICRLVCAPIMLVTAVLYVCFLLCLILSSPIVCIFCGKEIGLKVWIATACIIVGIPCVALQIVWAVLACVIWLSLVPCGAREMQWQFLVGAPFLTFLSITEGLLGFNRFDNDR